MKPSRFLTNYLNLIFFKISLMRFNIKGIKLEHERILVLQ
jgi:hypothetical protein